MDIVKAFIENILYPVMEKRKGNKVRKYIDQLTSSQSLSNEELYDLQREKLKMLLLESIDNVPAYQAYSWLKDDIEKDAFHALKNFPILRKKHYTKESESYINTSVDRSSLIKNQSGGSSGEPVVFYMDRKTVEHYEAARWRGLSWWGITPGSRSIMIWGNPIELSQMDQRKYYFKEKWLKNRILIPAYSLESSGMENYIKKIESYKPEYFYGYASSLNAFAILMMEQNITLSFKPKALVSTAEVLHDFQRENIEKAFGCKVVNEYGARDAGILAFQCDQGNMHISSENAILEVVDPITFDLLPNGESGILLVTDLNNHSMPRLRYAVGDRAALSDESCQCGINLPILEKIDGREDDVFITIDGKFVHGHLFSHIARDIDAIDKFQIVQESPSEVKLKVIVTEGHEEEEVNIFLEKIKELLPKTNIDFKIVRDIPTSKSGKFRYSIRNFKLD